MLSKDFKEFLELLNENNVRYLVVDGYAVAFHGYPHLPKTWHKRKIAVVLFWIFYRPLRSRRGGRRGCFPLTAIHSISLGDVPDLIRNKMSFYPCY